MKGFAFLVINSKTSFALVSCECRPHIVVDPHISFILVLVVMFSYLYFNGGLNFVALVAFP